MSPVSRILAIDFGEKRVGLALSDPLKIFAKPLKVIPNKGFESVLSKLLSLVQEYDIELILLGMPYAIEGGNTAKTDETQAFMDKLTANLETPIIAWDERYTTSEAIAELIKMGYDWKERRQVQDAMAAAMILKSYLESL